MITQEDSNKLIKDMKKVFVTDENFDKVIDIKLKRHTKIIVDEIKKVLDVVGEVMNRLDANKIDTNDALDDHEKRLENLENKVYV